jgi:hypothetical protein
LKRTVGRGEKVGWLRKTCFCAIALVFISTKGDARVSIRFMEPYSVEGLGVGTPVVPESRRSHIENYITFVQQHCDLHKQRIDCRHPLLIERSMQRSLAYRINSIVPRIFTHRQISLGFREGRSRRGVTSNFSHLLQTIWRRWRKGRIHAWA